MVRLAGTPFAPAATSIRLLVALLAAGTALGGVWASPIAAQNGMVIMDASANEAGSSGFGQMAFVVRVTRDTLSAPGQVSVQWQVASGTATVSTTQCGPGIDIVAQPGLVYIAPNTSEGTILVTICEDAIDEADAETFTITLLSASGAAIQDGQATGTLFDDDPTPSLRVADVSAAEGNAGEQRNLTFTLTLSAASGRQVSVNYGVAPATGAGAPVGGAGCGGAVDFVTRSGSETFAPGTATRQVTVTLCGDARFEADERVVITLTAPVNATLADGTGIGTISNDDAQPMVAINTPNDGLVTEGTGQNQVVSIQVTLSGANHDGASVVLRRGGTAERGTTCTGSVDILAPDEVTVTWPANDNTARTVDFTVCGDTRDEENDTVEYNVVGGAVAGVPSGEVLNRMVIFDDDQPPAITVADVLVVEGELAVVNITLSTESNREVEVLLAATAASIRPGTRRVALATLGASCGGAVDFVKTSRRIRVAPGQLTSTTPFRITTCSNPDGATIAETGITEVFQVVASDPTNATLARAVATVAIRDP